MGVSPQALRKHTRLPQPLPQRARTLHRHGTAAQANHNHRGSKMAKQHRRGLC